VICNDCLSEFAHFYTFGVKSLPKIVLYVGKGISIRMENAYKILVRKPEGRRRLLRAGHRWEDNIRMYLSW
jgi:hypothetical protein